MLCIKWKARRVTHEMTAPNWFHSIDGPIDGYKLTRTANDCAMLTNFTAKN